MTTAKTSTKTVVTTTTAGDVTITSHFACSQLDNITRINGNLLIKAAAALTSLSCLSNLLVVTGSLTILGNDDLGTAVLPSLTSVGTYIYIGSNSKLTDVSFSQLSSIGSFVDVSDNDQLQTISLPRLSSTGDFFDVYENTKLTTLLANALRTVTGHVQIRKTKLTQYDGMILLACVLDGRTDLRDSSSSAFEARVKVAAAAWRSPTCV